MARSRSKRAEKAEKFRAIVEALRLRLDVEWRPYEEKFLESQTRRPEDYDFTDPQWGVLNVANGQCSGPQALVPLDEFFAPLVQISSVPVDLEKPLFRRELASLCGIGQGSLRRDGIAFLRRRRVRHHQVRATS